MATIADRDGGPAGTICRRQVEEGLAVRLGADIARQGAAPPPIRLAFVPKSDRTAQRVGKQSVVGRRHTLATPETGSEA